MVIFAVGVEFRVEADSREEALELARRAMQRRRVPFAWDVHYSEVHEDDENG